MRRITRWVCVAAVAVSLAGLGCSSGSLDDAENVRTWATTGSAVAVYSHGHDPIAFADGHSPFSDPTCPVTTDDGTTATISGECTDNTGTTWTGTATVVRAGTDRMLMLEAFGRYDDPSMHATETGTITLRLTGASMHEFAVDVIREGGIDTTIHYAGSVEGTYDAATVWNGTGTIERDGLVEPDGTISATTVDERLDSNVCPGQPLSGTTTIEQDGESAVVTYDGATDCDDAKAARWSYEGEDRGLVSGIDCAVAAPGADIGAGASAAWSVVVAGLIAVVLRRRRRSGSAGRVGAILRG